MLTKEKKLWRNIEAIRKRTEEVKRHKRSEFFKGRRMKEVLSQVVDAKTFLNYQDNLKELEAKGNSVRTGVDLTN